MRTWQVEMMIVATILSIVVIITGQCGSYIEWVGTAAVLLTFGHAQVSDRLAENAGFAATRGLSSDHTVECFRWTNRYLVGKECLWMVYFVMHQSWSALAGVGIFLMYPFWRAWWNSR